MSDPFTTTADVRKAPGSLAQLQRRIGDVARERSISVKRANQRVMTEVVLATLARAKTAGVIDMYLAKGGMALEIRFGIRARASLDLDVGIISSGTELLEAFDRSMNLGFDKFTFERKRDARLLENVATYRLQIQVSYMGRPFGSLPVDLNHASYETAITVEETGFLTALGLPGPHEVALLDPYLQIAHTLHGATEPSRADYRNLRHRDLLDIIVMTSDAAFDIDIPRLRRTIVDEFARRPRHQHWPPVFELPEDWRTELERDAAAIGIEPADADALNRRFLAFIDRIESSGTNETHESQAIIAAPNGNRAD